MTTSSVSFLKRLMILFLVIAGVYYARAFLIPLSIGGVLAALFLPFCRKMEDKNVHKGIAVLICILILLLTIAFVSALLGWQVSELFNDFALLKMRFTVAVNTSQEYIFSHLGISKEKQMEILTNEQPSVSSIMQSVGVSLATVISNLILVLAYIFLLLFYRGHIRQFFLRLALPAQRSEMEQVLQSITRVSQQYLLGLAKMIVCLWILYGIGFSILGVKNALFFAILCGLLEIIPFIGNLTGSLLTLLVSAVQGAGMPMLAGIAGTYGLVQFLQGWVLEPLIVGPHVKINPFAIILSLVVGEMVWGIPGIFLSIPLLAMFKIVCDHIEPLKPYGFLLGEVESKNSAPGLIKKIKRWMNKILSK
jgi:predicted PurR-regulated permease PerM